MKRDREKEAAEARRNVQRMQEQSEKLLTGSANADDENDPIVILGRRIGRGIGYILGAGLLIYLIATYVVR